ncbi:hypothetical protein ACK3Y5_19740 [Aeromonas caviae]
MAKSSGRQNKAIPELICEAFDRPEKEFLDLLADLKLQSAQDYSSLADFKYGDLFNQKVLDLAATDSFDQELTDYVETYEKLISESAVLSRNFNHQKAVRIPVKLNSDSGICEHHFRKVCGQGFCEQKLSFEGRHLFDSPNKPAAKRSAAVVDPGHWSMTVHLTSEFVL